MDEVTPPNGGGGPRRPGGPDRNRRQGQPGSGRQGRSRPGRRDAGRGHVGPLGVGAAPPIGGGDRGPRYAPRPVVPRPEDDGRPPGPSALKRLEEEEREQARRAETVRVGFRLSAMGLVVLGMFAVIVFRLWSMQVLDSSNARHSVLNLTTATVPLTPARGLIEARGGQVLVSDDVETVVTLSRQVAANDPVVVRRLAAVLGISSAQIESDLSDQQDSIYEPVPVDVGASPAVVVFLSEHHDLFPGVSVSNVAERQYPYGSLAAQTLGYVADISSSELHQLKSQGYTAGDVIGQSGIEAAYEQYLRGRVGKKVLYVDAAGAPVGTKQVDPPRSGDDVVLNLDLGLQQAAEGDLAAQLQSLRSQGIAATSGAVVVEDVQNGAVLAMASAPTYDPAWWVGGMSTSHYEELTSASSNYPLLNRATQGLYAPGSTFKLATATAALDDGLISPYTYISDPGQFTIPNCTGTAGCVFHNNESESCGSCDVETALTMSDDVFFYTLGYWFYSDPSRYGTEPIQKVANEYGFGTDPGIDLPGAYSGQVDSPALRAEQHKEDPSAFPDTYYGPGDAINTAFGQGETVITPLELANAYATFANGGTRYAPEVAAEIISPTGTVVKRIAPKVLGHVYLPEQTRQAIMTGLVGVTTATGPEGGTATSTLQALHYPYSELPIAGKTGTSQVSASSNVLPDALFVAFGPVADPKYVIATVIPNVGYGAQYAAPVVVKLFEYLINHPVGSVTPSTPAGAG